MRNISDSGSKSLSVSNGNDLNSVGLEASELADASKVRPSGECLGNVGRRQHAARASAVFDNDGLAEPLLQLCRFMPRTTTSRLPPAGNDTMMAIGPDG